MKPESFVVPCVEPVNDGDDEGIVAVLWSRKDRVQKKQHLRKKEELWRNRRRMRRKRRIYLLSENLQLARDLF